MNRPRSLAPLALLGALGAGTAGAQPTLDVLALTWIQGEYRAPIVCTIEGVPRRALRRVRVTPGTREAHRPMDRLVFFDLEAPPQTICHDATGGAEPNIVGTLVLTHESRTDRPDTAQHDFAETLRREGGFEYRIASGTLRSGPPGVPPDRLSVTSFKGGTAAFRIIRRGTDAFRRLVDLGPFPKLALSLEATDGTRIEIELVQVEGP